MFESGTGSRDHQSSRDPGDKPARVLLADDDPDIRDLIAEALRRSGYDVLETRDGGELLSVIESMRKGERPLCDVIVSDVQMPGVSGLEALQHMRDNGVRVPVIIITAFTEPEVSSRARMLGAAALLNKPLALRELQKTIDRVAHSTP